MQATPSAIAPVFDQSVREFETRTRRHIAEGGVEYIASAALTFKGSFRQTDREGTIPFGGSFGHSSLVEMPAPTRHTLSDTEASAEYSARRRAAAGRLSSAHGSTTTSPRSSSTIRSASPTSPRHRRAAG